MHSIFEEEKRSLALLPSYLAMIEASVDSKMFRQLFVTEYDGSHTDVIGNGDLACAFYVSALLHIFNLVKTGVHTTVDKTEWDMTVLSQWYLLPSNTVSVMRHHLSQMPRGSVIIWGKKMCTDGLQHRHIGFYMGEKEAISNRPDQGSPQRHHYTFGENDDGSPVRPIEKVYFHPLLEALPTVE
ncbi:MAG: hypothetical protein HYV45_01105 [Candidatus Moranbacteria bacterium]|nr:hypothetical protein [Candidatus Moranbacteria bacterium]